MHISAATRKEGIMEKGKSRKKGSKAHYFFSHHICLYSLSFSSFLLFMEYIYLLRNGICFQNRNGLVLKIT